MSSLSKRFGLFAFSLFTLWGQEQFRQMHERSEQEKREFVRDYMATAAAAGALPDTLEPFLWRGEAFPDTGSTMATLVAQYPWAQEAVADEIERVSALSPQPVDYLTRLAFLMAAAKNLRSFEMMQARFRRHPLYLDLMEMLVSGSMGPGPWPAFDCVYRALASEEKEVRDIAIRRIAGYFDVEHNERQESWAKALLRRYGRVPTDAELFSDPVMAALRDNHPGRSVLLGPRVREQMRDILQSKAGGKP